MGCHALLRGGGGLPDPGIEPMSPASPAWQAYSLPLSHRGSPLLPGTLWVSFLLPGLCVNHREPASELLPTPRVTEGSVLCPAGVCVFHSILSCPVPQGALGNRMFSTPSNLSCPAPRFTGVRPEGSVEGVTGMRNGLGRGGHGPLCAPGTPSLWMCPFGSCVFSVMSRTYLISGFRELYSVCLSAYLQPFLPSSQRV